LGISIGRSYLGMHTFDQVLLGIIYGSYFCYLLINFIDPKLDLFLQKVLTRNLENKNMFLWAFLMTYIILSLIPVILFISLDINNPINQSDLWTDYWLVVKNKLGVSPMDFAYNKCFLDCSMLGAMFGAIVGITITEGEFLNKDIPVLSLSKTTIVFRVVLASLLFICSAGIMYFIPAAIPNYILMYFLNNNIALFLGTLVLVRYTPTIYSLLKLDVEGDLLRKLNH
jgi:hypothetical protein